MARTDKKKTNDPHGLVPWVKGCTATAREWTRCPFRKFVRSSIISEEGRVLAENLNFFRKSRQFPLAMDLRNGHLAGQPDSPSRRAGWGLILNAVGASCPISFTIQASWMGSLPDLCVTTSRLPPANGYEPYGFGLIGPRTLRSDEPFFCTAKPRNLPIIHGFNSQSSTFNGSPSYLTASFARAIALGHSRFCPRLPKTAFVRSAC